MRLSILCLLALSTIGCNSLNRLMEGAPAEPAQAPTVIHGGGTLGPTPTFNVPIPAGYTRTVLHQFLPSDGRITGLESSRMDVFMKDEVSGQWFRLGTSYSSAWYYTYANSSITVHGNTLDKKEICIYEYIQGE